MAASLVCACSGWSAVLVAGGGMLGYWSFWDSAGYQGVVWTALSLCVAVCLRDRRLCRAAPLLLPSICALIVATSGVLFQSLLLDGAAIPLYLLRVALAFGVTWLFSLALQGRNPLLD